MLRLKQAFALILWLPFAALAETAPEVPDYPADRIAENTVSYTHLTLPTSDLV